MAGQVEVCAGAGNPVLIPQTQADNDLPVHLKGGGMDNILYRLTMTLTLGGECRAHWLAPVVGIARIRLVGASEGVGPKLTRSEDPLVLRKGAMGYLEP